MMWQMMRSEFYQQKRKRPSLRCKNRMRGEAARNFGDVRVQGEKQRGCQPKHQKSHNLSGWRGGNGGREVARPVKIISLSATTLCSQCHLVKIWELGPRQKSGDWFVLGGEETSRSVPKFSPIIYHFSGGKGRPSTQVQSHGERGNPFSCVTLNTSVFTPNRTYRYYTRRRQ